MFHAEFEERGAVTERLPRRGVGSQARGVGSVEADTLRSVRSLASVKSVTIHPEVTEYHYRGRSEAGSYHNPPTEEEEEATLAPEDVPAPVYPSLDWREKRRGLTRDQIIGYYCQQGDAVL